MFISNWWIKACIFFKSCPTPVQMCSDLPLLVRPGYCLSVSLIDRPDILCPRPHCPILTSDWSSSLFPSSSLLRLQSDSKFCPLIIFLLWTLITADWAAAALLSSSILSLHHGFVSFCYWFFSLSFVQFFPSCFFLPFVIISLSFFFSIPSLLTLFFLLLLSFVIPFLTHFIQFLPTFLFPSFPPSFNFVSFIPSYWPCSASFSFLSRTDCYYTFLWLYFHLHFLFFQHVLFFLRFIPRSFSPSSLLSALSPSQHAALTWVWST